MNKGDVKKSGKLIVSRKKERMNAKTTRRVKKRGERGAAAAAGNISASWSDIR